MRLIHIIPIVSILLESPLVLEALIPQSPSGLRSWPLSENAVQLEWKDQADNETAYEVHRRTGRNGPWTVLTDVLAPDSTHFTDGGVQPDTLYHYQVLARNSDGAAFSNLAQAITDDRPSGNRSLSFQEGVGDYSGTVDVGIQENAPSGSNTSTYVWIDNNGLDGDNQALLDFGGIFGDAPDRLPPGAVITRASLRLYLGTNSNAQTYKPIAFHQMLVPWTVQSSWASPGFGGNGVQADDQEARSEMDAFCVFAEPGQYYEIDVTPSLRSWSAGEPQYGWNLRTNWGDGYAYYTSHNPVISQCPELIVSYDLDPANKAPVVERILSPLPDARGLHEPVQMEFEVSDPNGDPVEVTIYGRKVPVSNDPDFRVILLPDTQNYCATQNGATPYIFYDQVEWIIENREAMNIPFVLHMGDMVENGDLKGSSLNMGEWVVAANALYRMHSPAKTGLAEGLPFGVNVGNHDQEPIWRSSGTTEYFNKYFGVDHFQRFSYFGGNFGDNNDNHFYLFKAGTFDFIVISLEYCDPARDPVDPDLLEWVDGLLKQYPDHRGIIVSHHMINPGNPGTWSPYGEILYEVLKDNPNLHLMLGGHVTGEGLRVDTFQDNTVYALVQDYQGYPQGGGGFLRILTFSPGHNEIQLDTYSPWLDTYLDEFGGAFNLPYNLGTPIEPFMEIARVDDVGNNSVQLLSWEGLEPDTEYEWVIDIGDGRKSMKGIPRRFRTANRTYSSWRSRYFTEGDLNGEPALDPDGDGFSNHLEFVFDGDPTVRGQLQTAVHSAILSQESLNLEYERMRGNGLTWTYEHSPDLLEWTRADPGTSAIQEAIEDLGNGMERVQVVIENPSSGPLFWRIRAQMDSPVVH